MNRLIHINARLKRVLTFFVFLIFSITSLGYAEATLLDGDTDIHGQLTVKDASGSNSLVIESNHADGARLKIKSTNSSSGWKAPVIDLSIADGSSNLIFAHGDPNLSGIWLRPEKDKHIVFDVDRDNSASNVGIGVNSPSEKLEVNGTVKATAFVGDGSGLTGISGSLIEGTINNGGSWDDTAEANTRLNFNDANFGIGAGYFGLDGGHSGSNSEYLTLYSYAGAGRGIRFAAKSAGSSTKFSDFDTHMIIRADTGNVGIGTTSPDTLLEVGGNGWASKIRVSRSDSAHLEIDANQIWTTGDKLHLNYNNNNDVILGYGGGNVGIGTTDPGYKLDVNGTLNYSGSSIKYKENINDLEIDSSLVYKLRPVSYDYKAEHKGKGFNKPSGRELGLIAEEVADTIPELTILAYGEIDNVDYQKLSILLLAELKKLKERVDELENK